MSKNPQLDASQNSLAVSKDRLAHTVNAVHQLIYDSKMSHDEAMRLDDLIKMIQHYTYRVALSNHSVKLAEQLQNVYLGCSDPTGSAPYWQFNGTKALENLQG
jgi:hypothetical protein